MAMFRLLRRAAGGRWSTIAVLLVLLAAVVCAHPAAAADPVIGSIAPWGGQRGTQLDLVLSGARMGAPQEIYWYEPGISVSKLEAVGDQRNAVKAHLALAPDCRLGEHAMRLRTATGISNLVTFSVGALPEINEAPPNNDFDHPQKINLDTTVNGVVQNEEVDYFMVEAKKGERLAVEVEAFRLGSALFDPSVAILNKNRFVLASADDTPLVWLDGACSIIVPEDGPYVIEVRESAYGGSPQSRYRLHVGRFPRPLAVFPPGGKLGQTLEIRWLGDVAGPRTENVALPAAPQADFGLFAKDDRGIAPSSVPLRLCDLDNVLEAKPNQTPAQATAFTPPAALNGILAAPGDAGCFKFAAKAGQVYEMRVWARKLRSPVDSVLSVSRSNGAPVAANDDSDGPDSYLRFQAPADDQYIVRVTDQLGRGGPHFVYRLEVAPVRPQLTVGLPEREQFVDIVLPVPKANRMATMLSVQREDFAGKVDLELKGLPPGITAQPVPVAEGESAVPLLLSAAADAAPSGTLVDLLGRATVGSQTIAGRLRQHTSLLRGANNVDVWSRDTHSAAAAVTDPVPFTVDLVEPKAPLVQSGSMELKVVATRQAGFTAPINVRMLYNPPGVSSPDSVTIPEKQNEVALPLTAAAGAKAATWPVAVLAETAVGDGTVRTASRLVNLQVAEPFFVLTFPRLTLDQGQEGELALAAEKKKDFEGQAQLELLGLPPEVTTRPCTIPKDAKEAVFPIKTSAKSPAGLHKTLACRAVITVAGEPVTHLFGPGELRIQPPAPPKPAAAAAPAPAPAPKPAAAPPAEKRLSRLEQLRRDREQQKKTPEQPKPEPKPEKKP